MWEKLISLISKLAETYLLTFVLLFGVGAILLAVGATGEVPQLGITVFETFWRDIIGGCGVILLGVAVVFAFVAMKTSTRQPLDGKSFGVTIESPNDGSNVTVPCEVRGKSKELPEKAQLWLFIIRGSGKAAFYSPQDGIDVKNGSWRTELRARKFKPGDKRKFAIFLVGEDGQALIKFYKTAGKEIEAIDPDRKWPEIQEKTADISAATETLEVTLTGRA